MDDRTATLMAWLEAEGERERRPVLPPPTAYDPDPRGWVQTLQRKGRQISKSAAAGA